MELGYDLTLEEKSGRGGRSEKTRGGTGKHPVKVPKKSNKNKISNTVKIKANHKVKGKYKEMSKKDEKQEHIDGLDKNSEKQLRSERNK